MSRMRQAKVGKGGKSKSYVTAISGITNTGKTYGYLDYFNHPNMKDKNMFILITDTSKNIIENINTPAYEKFKDRIIYLVDDNGLPLVLSHSSKGSVSKINQIVKEFPNMNLGCIVIDNYDSIEEMYIQEFKNENDVDKIMGYDYGVPRGKTRNKYVYPLMQYAVRNDISFFITANVKEIYSNGSPTGRYETSINDAVLVKCSEIIYIQVLAKGTPQQKYKTWVYKWKGTRNRSPIDIGDENLITEIIKKIEN